jgi:hypothetical protein
MRYMMVYIILSYIYVSYHHVYIIPSSAGRKLYLCAPAETAQRRENGAGTFVHSPSLVVWIPSMEVVEAKKNLDLVPSV